MKEENANPHPIRVRLIGCGFYAQNHLRAWRDLAREGADLVAICAPARFAGGRAAHQSVHAGRLRAGRPADTSGEDNLKTYALTEAAYELLKTHAGVRPKA
jgi:predicted dehydrogenase